MGNPSHTKSWAALSHDAIQDMTSKPLKTNKVICPEDSLQGKLRLDLSYSGISDDIWRNLCALATEQNVTEMRDKMVSGDAINFTEGRAVGHVWLRDGKRADVLDVLNRMKHFCQSIHDGGQYTDVVHIGIGGSDLGPRLVCDALRHLPKKMNVHFVANVDGADIAETLKGLNPDTTLFIIASKTFTTIETMTNAKVARDWLDGRDVAKHMIALSTNSEAVSDFGIDVDNMFPFWDWVGGRFSVWSAIGMPIALTYGFDVFQNFLNGAKAMDDHFVTADMDKNIPVLMALYGIWNRNFLNRSALAVLPYAQNLHLLPNFLQQLDMESNGKSVDRDGDFIADYKTGPIIFGQAGTNGQHAFHQWLHQGTDIVPVELIAFDETPYDKGQQNILNANACAQMQAFFEGMDSVDDKHRHYNGGRPSVALWGDEITPWIIGAILAFYEHKIFTQGVIWNINSFDQFGVELGKILAKQRLPN